jgi:tRNA pseudouridine38-40 synthase
VPTYRLTLEYDGAGFAGWQRQPVGQRSVQGELEGALRRVTGEAVRVVGAGRTDAGVHAEAQVASFRLEAAPDPLRLGRALNGVLPRDVAVRGCEKAPDDFHARFAALSKLYRYRIWNGASRSPLREARSHWVRSPLDLAAMRRAGRLLEGTHDFACFQKAGSPQRSSVRTLRRVGVEGEPRGEVAISLEGDGFLRHMVRIVAGTLVGVGLGRRPAEEMPALLACRDRTRAGRTAPARGLVLVRVDY